MAHLAIVAAYNRIPTKTNTFIALICGHALISVDMLWEICDKEAQVRCAARRYVNHKNEE